MSDNFKRSLLELWWIVFLIGVMHLAGIDRVIGSPMDDSYPPEKFECVGKLELTDDSKAIRLNTEMMHNKKFNYRAIACQESIIDKKHIEKVRAVCEIGDICEIDGMIKGYSHDVFDWMRINRVKKRA